MPAGAVEARRAVQGGARPAESESPTLAGASGAPGRTPRIDFIGDDVFHGGSVSVRFVAGTRGHSVARSECPAAQPTR